MTSYKKIIFGFGTLHLLLVVFLILFLLKNNLPTGFSEDQITTSYTIKKSVVPVTSPENLSLPQTSNTDSMIYLLVWLVGLFPMILFSTVVVKKIKKSRSKQNDLIGKNKNRELFFSIVSHDLKTPSQQLIGLSEMILSEQQLKEEELRRITKMINVSARRQYELLSNLLAWSTSKLHGKEIYQTDCNLNSIIEEQLAGQKEKIEEKKLVIMNHLQQNIILSSNENLLATVIRNILTNSIKFTREGGQIEINCAITKKEIIIQIDDNGLGMSEETVKNLFDLKYIRSKRGTHKETGSGIGLILCKEILEKMKGTIMVSSKENEGTSATIKLPNNVKED